MVFGFNTSELKTMAVTGLGVVSAGALAYCGLGVHHHHRHHHHRHHHTVIGTAAVAAVALFATAAQLEGKNQMRVLKAAMIPTGICLAGAVVLYLEAHLLFTIALSAGVLALAIFSSSK